MFDSIAIDMHRLFLAHCIAAVTASAALWIRLGPEYSSPTYHRAGGTILVVTLGAWLPYALSWAIARKLLPGRGVALGFAICLATVCVISCLAYLGLLGIPPHTIGISVATAVTLILLVLCCAAFGRRMPSSNKSLERTRDR
jgi:hypothetical protein